MKKYKPISCSFVDIIEHYAVLKENVITRYKEADQILEKNAVIKTWYNDGKAEYMSLIGFDHDIRIDKIISINEHDLKNYC